MTGTFKKIFKLFCIGFGLWFFFAVFTPFFVSFFPSWQKYNQVQEEMGLDSGALYYSNIPNILDAELHMREAISKGMQDRREKRLEAKSPDK